MQPGPDERLAGRRLALGDLVLVVREDQVDAAGVDVERRPEVRPCSSPSTRCASRAGPARSPSSHDGSPGFGALPQREVADVVLGVLVGLDALADPQLLGIEPRQPAVGRPRRDPEEDRAVVGAIGVARARAASRSASTISSMCSVARGRTSGRVMPQRVGVRQERGRDSGRRARRSSSPAAAAPRMILSSMSVMFITQRDRVARASAGAGRAGRRTGTSGSCRCAPARRPSGRRSRCRRARRRSGTSGRVSPDSVSWSRIVIGPPRRVRDRQRRDRRGRRPRRRRGCRSTP